MLGSQNQTSPKALSRLLKGRDTARNEAKVRYFLVWRWHFFAGLFVIPFMLMLSFTGLVMLFDDEIEHSRYAQLIDIAPEGEMILPSQQLALIQASYPESAVTQFVSSHDPAMSNRFNVREESGRSVLVTINQYTGEVLGEIDRSDSWYQLANDIHGTLLIGDLGDYLIEISASLTILLLVTGLYLWLPFNSGAKAGFLKVRFSSGSRVVMRDIHANLGGMLSIILLLFVLSGLAWAGVWGAKMVQGWNTFPTFYTWGEKPESTITHAELNHGSEEEMPWNLEQALVPQSHLHHSDSPSSANGYDQTLSVNLDVIVNRAKALGFEQFKVFLPQSETGVYTVAANSMAGDISDPRKDRTTHFDQYSGELLIDVTWRDYSAIAKLMAAGVSLHQGDISIINKALNVLFCIAFIVISITGVTMWWSRRPKQGHKLGVPARYEQDGVWKASLVTIVLIGICFPMAGLIIVTTLVIDWLVVRRSDKLTAYLS